MSAVTAQQTPGSPLGESARAKCRQTSGERALRKDRLTTDLGRAAELLELWRLCRKSQCRRARSCRGEARECCEMAVDWSEQLRLKSKRVSFAEAIERLRKESG